MTTRCPSFHTHRQIIQFSECLTRRVHLAASENVELFRIRNTCQRTTKLPCAMTTVAMYHSSNPKRDPLVQYKTVDEPELQKSSSTSKPFILADIGEGIAEVELIQWYVAPGDAIRQFDKVCEVQSDKATVDISSRFDGIVDKLCGQKGDVMKVGQPLLFIRPEGSARHDANVKPNSESLHNVDHQADQLRIPTGEDGMGDFESRIKSTKDADLTLEKVLTSPAVRKLGKDYGINLNQVIGTGPQGRIMKSDVEKHMQEMSMSHGIATRTVDTKPDSPSTTSYDQTIPLRGYHRLMASTMLLSLQVPHMCYSDEVNVTELKKFREDLKSTLEDRQVKLSYLPFAIKACSLSMKEYPIMNSTIDMENMSLIFHRDHNIGIAMDSPRGLVVPVIQKCQDLSILEIALNLKSLQEKAMDSTLSEEELTTPTFTLSNIGALGGTYMKPVVLPPQVAIGAMGKIQRLPRFVGSTNNVEEAYILNISWGGDHRALDGATLARFSNSWKGYMEKPSTMIISMK